MSELMRYFYSSTCANVSEATHQRWRDRILRREGQRRWNLLSQRIMVAIEGVVELGKLIRWTSVSPQSIWKAVSKAVHAVHLGPGEHCERLDGPARLPLIGLSATRSESTRYHLESVSGGYCSPELPAALEHATWAKGRNNFRGVWTLSPPAIRIHLSRDSPGCKSSPHTPAI